MRIFGGEFQEIMPRFTPDGQAVVLVPGPTTSRNNLWVQPLEGGRPHDEATQLTTHRQGEVGHPALSPDGRWVTYYRVVKGQRDVWVGPMRGGSPVQLTTDPASDIEPAWSHDGKHLAFASQREGWRFSIWRVPIAHGRAAGNEELVAAGTNALAPEWSPDDEWIAYVDAPTTPDGDVWKIRADLSGTPRSVTTKAGALRVRWSRQDQMVVAGWWGEHTLSRRLVDPNTGISTPLVPPVVLGDNPSACDFDIDLDRGLAVFARCTRKAGNIWTLTKQQ